MDYQAELDNFREYLKHRASPGTVRIYIHALKLWFERLDSNAPSQQSAQAYIDGLLSSDRSASTVTVRAHAIMRWFRWKGKQVRLDCPTIRMGEPKYLTVEQIEELVVTCNTVLETVLVINLFDTALRINELLNIELDDIDWDNGFLTVTGKGGKKESVNISEKALGALSDWLEARSSNSKRVFMDLEYNYVWNILKKLGERANMQIHPHIFRHSRAIHMLMNGAEIYIVKDHLRHKRIATTIDIYGRFMVGHLKEKVPTW